MLSPWPPRSIAKHVAEWLRDTASARSTFVPRLLPSPCTKSTAAPLGDSGVTRVPARTRSSLVTDTVSWMVMAQSPPATPRTRPRVAAPEPRNRVGSAGPEYRSRGISTNTITSNPTRSWPKAMRSGSTAHSWTSTVPPEGSRSRHHPVACRQYQAPDAGRIEELRILWAHVQPGWWPPAQRPSSRSPPARRIPRRSRRPAKRRPRPHRHLPATPSPPSTARRSAGRAAPTRMASQSRARTRSSARRSGSPSTTRIPVPAAPNSRSCDAR